MIGTLLGKYRIVEKIGSGGMADVYKGLQVGLEREVAIKVLPPAYAKDVQMVKRFKRESQATAKLSHPNIVTIYDSGEQDGCFYYVMEYLKADALDDILAKEKVLPLKQGLKISKDILKALVYTHDKQIIHRDLKPSNIKFDLRGNAIVTDFGLVKDLEQTSITMTGISLGTPQYMSPELLRGDLVDHRSDIYQLGVIVYEMLTGQVPFSGSTPYADPDKDLESQMTPPSALNADVSTELEQFIVRCLHPKPEDRFQSAKEALEAISKIERKIEAKRMSRQASPSAVYSSGNRSQSLSVGTQTAGITQATRATALGEERSFLSSISTLYAEKTPAEIAYQLAIIVGPAILLIVAAIFVFNTIIFPRPPLKLLEQALEIESKRSIISWKCNNECYSFIQYYTNLENKKQTPLPQVKRMEYRVPIENLEPDTTYYFQFVFTYDLDDRESYVYSNEFEFKTKPEIKIRDITVEARDTQVTITWSTNLETDTKIKIGTTRSYTREQENPEQKRETDHSITVTGLDPDTTYHYVIIAADPDQEGEEIDSGDRIFKTLSGRSASIIDPHQSSDPPLVELAKSYVDKLTRMTPDEREKLKKSLKNFLITDEDNALTSERKKALLRDKSNEQNFYDRLRYLTIWSGRIEKDGKKLPFEKTETTMLQNLFYLNPKKAYSKLDAHFQALGRLDP